MITRRAFVAAMAAAGVSVVHSIGGAAAGGGPKSVLLIRHAEERKGAHLSQEGQARAKKLPTLFPRRFDTPTALYAARTTAASARCVETLEPLAGALRLSINQAFGDTNHIPLAKAVRALNGAVVVICWKHDGLPALARALGVRNPPVWPRNQFNHVWHISYSSRGDAALKDHAQRLLPGDN
jgi:hypothetical protein